MIKPSDPRDLVVDLIPRSTCCVQVSAVIADNRGIFAWGWNSPGGGYGEHAEMAAIRRSNKNRLHGATIYVGSVRQRTGKSIKSKPCPDCQYIIDKYELQVVWRNANEEWIYE